MNISTGPILGWWLHTLVGGGVLLLLAWLLMKRIAQPARRQRLAEWALLGALLLAGLSLAPSWLVLPLPWLAESPPQPVAVAAAPAEPVPELPEAGAEIAVPVLAGEVPDPIPPQPAVEAQPPVAPAVEVPSPASHSGWSVTHWLLCLYAGCSLLLLGRWLLGHLALARLVRSAQPAPAGVRRLCLELCLSRRVPRLLVSPRVRVPFSFGLFRPTIVLPADLLDEMALRWVLAHELEHLERRDAWACLLFGLGQVVYFVLPWFWWLRRQVRLCQEYVADAAAARSAGQPEDYAQLLLGWSRAPRLPVGVTGVSGPSSDLYRRIAMLLQSSTPVEKRCPRSWSLLMGAGLLGLSVIVAGVGLKAIAAPVSKDARKDEPKKEEPKKEEPRKVEPKKEEPKKEEPRKNPRGIDPFDLMPDFDKLFENLPGADEQQMKLLREQMKKAMEQARQMRAGQLPGLVPVFPGGALPDNFKQIQDQIRKVQEEQRKAMEQFRQLRGGQLPGGAFPVFPAFPNLPGRRGQAHEGRLGARVEKPGETLIEQLDLPRGQGLILDSVKADSPAEKVGLKAHDILMEVNGKPVPSDAAEFAKQVQEIKAKTPVDVVVLRRGKKETLKGLTLPEARVEKPVERPRLNFNFPNVFPGGKGVEIQTTRNGDEFTTTRKEGEQSITVSGKVADGKAVPAAIEINDGKESKKYESVEKVPEQYRNAVKTLLQTVTGKGGKRGNLQEFEAIIRQPLAAVSPKRKRGCWSLAWLTEG